MPDTIKFFLSKMQKDDWQYKTKVKLLLNNEKMRMYLNCLINNSSRIDEFGEWFVNVEYEE